MGKKTLQFQQINRKMQAFSALQKVPMPPTGWIKAIRLAIGMSAEQLGKRLSITRQGAIDLENREVEGSVSIKSLREVANALEMQLVYGFVPKDGTLEALIDRKAKELAIRIVKRTSTSMMLEDQENSNERLAKAIEERTFSIKNEMPKSLWD